MKKYFYKLLGVIIIFSAGLWGLLIVIQLLIVIVDPSYLDSNSDWFVCSIINAASLCLLLMCMNKRLFN